MDACRFPWTKRRIEAALNIPIISSNNYKNPSKERLTCENPFAP
jgi:hypothetical protein